MGILNFLSRLFVLGALSLSQLAGAQTTASIAEEFENLSSEKKELFNVLADELRCPTCTGLSINQSDAPFSLQIRQAVLEQVQAGNNHENIIKFFTERYGLWILREPPAKGFHFLAWLIPALVFILGPLGVWFFVWRKRVVSDTHGIRSTGLILKEFEAELTLLRGKEKKEAQT